MSYMVGAIDVHKKMLAVVAADAGQEGETPFERKKFGTRESDLRLLAAWLTELAVKDVVMESTAQYWKPIWGLLEELGFHLELAQAQSNQGPKGRKSDFRDAERLWRRYEADELILSFVPDPEQRIWRTQSRTQVRLVRDRSRIQNRLEALLEEMRIKLSSVISDLLGVSGRRILEAIAEGEADPTRLAEMGDPQLHASQAELSDALQGVKKLDARYRVVLKHYLEQLKLNERQTQDLKQGLADSLKPHAEVIERLAAIPGMGVDSAQQVVAETGVDAKNFETPANLSSWVGVSPGENESAGKSSSDRSAKGNEYMRRILDQTANAAIKADGTVFQARYQRIRGRDPKKHGTAVWAVAHHQCRVIWKVLHDGVKYEERGGQRDPARDRRRAARLLRELKSLGYRPDGKPLPTLSRPRAE